MKKTCSVCKNSLDFPENFFRDSRTKSGYRCRCKKCDMSISSSHTDEYKKRRATPEARAKNNAATRKLLQHLRDTDENYRKRKAENDKKYRQSPAGKMAKMIRKYRRRYENAEHHITAQQWKKIIEAFDCRCAYCLSEKNITLDHFVPLFLGGHTEPNNVVPACRHCNCSKQEKHPSVWCAPDVYARVVRTLEQLAN